MIVASREVRTRDGRLVTIRSARPRDAGRILDYAGRLIELEPEVNVPEPDEFDLTVEGITRFCRLALESETSLALVALTPGEEVVGFATLQGCKRRKLRHVAETGISVRADHRGVGLGRALMEIVVEQARRAPLRKVCLRVFSTNERALSFYEGLGFVFEGRRKDHLRIADEYVDELLMALHLEADG